MEIIFHSHHAAISDHMRRRARRLVERAALRVPRTVEGSVRFEEDGPTRRVTVVLRGPRNVEIMGRAEGRFFGPALASAIARVLAQAGKRGAAAGQIQARRLARVRARAADRAPTRS